MPYGKCKIYSDGSHYIAIPHTVNPHGRRRKEPVREEITVEQEISALNNGSFSEENEPVSHTENPEEAAEKTTKKCRTTRKELFEELYAAELDVRKRKRRKRIITAMLPYFEDEAAAAEYVDIHLQRKQRNLVARRVRLTRKVHLHDFNFFVTFTYDGSLHTEESFRKGLKTTLRNLCYRQNWKYVGVWERSPEKKRLHFHGLFQIPDGTMPGTIVEKKDYSFRTHRRQTTHQNTYFNERFGRSDFEPLDDKDKLGSAIAYLVKYLEKTGEKIVYSKGLPQYFISDVMDEDIVCRYGSEDKKLLLYDDFRCWDEGCLIGKVSKEVIAQLRKSN